MRPLSEIRWICYAQYCKRNLDFTRNFARNCCNQVRPLSEIGWNSCAHYCTRNLDLACNIAEIVAIKCGHHMKLDEIVVRINRPGELWNSAPVIFYDSISAVLYAENRELSSNACKKLITCMRLPVSILTIFSLFVKSKVATLISKSALKKSKLKCLNQKSKVVKNNQSSHFFSHLILLEHRK